MSSVRSTLSKKHKGPVRGRCENKADMKDIDNLETGDLLLIDSGEYSDKLTIGPFRVMKPMNRAVVSAQYVKDFKADPENANDEPHPDGFLPWLVRNGYVEDIPSVSWYVGSYGEFSQPTSASQ